MTIKPNDPVPTEDDGCQSTEGFAFSMLKADSGNVVNEFNDSPTKKTLPLVSRKNDYITHLNALGIEKCNNNFGRSGRLLKLSIGKDIIIGGLQDKNLFWGLTSGTWQLRKLIDGRWFDEDGDGEGDGELIENLNIGDLILVVTTNELDVAADPLTIPDNVTITDSSGNVYIQVNSAIDEKYPGLSTGETYVYRYKTRFWYAVNQSEDPFTITVNYDTQLDIDNSVFDFLFILVLVYRFPLDAVTPIQSVNIVDSHLASTPVENAPYDFGTITITNPQSLVVIAAQSSILDFGDTSSDRIKGHLFSSNTQFIISGLADTSLNLSGVAFVFGFYSVPTVAMKGIVTVFNHS